MPKPFLKIYYVNPRSLIVTVISFPCFVQGGEHGAVLTLTLNDMGNHGCYPDCEEGMSMPLYTEAMVNLMRKQPMSPFLAHSK